MAYIQPNGVIQLFRGINIDNRYLHTIYFANTSAQSAWFSSRVAYTFQNQSYTRYTRNQIKLKVDPTSVLDCTYLRFMNDRSVDKWFYAFINNVEYVNENTALITYEIDVMQTWFIQNGDILPCFVIREHVNDDTFGTQLEAEPVGSQEYDNDAIELTSGSVHTGYFNDYSLVIQSTGDPDDTLFTNHKFYNNGLFDGTRYIILPCNNESEAASKASVLLNMLGSWDKNQQMADVIDMYTFPTAFSDTDPARNMGNVNVVHPRNFDSYTPKNKKLFSYPYAFLWGTTMDGEDATYRWEYFDGDATQGNAIQFVIYGTPTAGGQIICYPKSYNGVVDNYDAKMVMDNFPKNAYNFDAYQAWIAAGGKTKLEADEKIMHARGITGEIAGASNVVSSVFDAIVSGASPTKAQKRAGMMGQAAAGIGAVNSVVQSVAEFSNTTLDYVEAQNKVIYEWKDAQYKPNITKGKSSVGVNVAQHILDFYFFHCHVRADEAKRIDDFFSTYGYAINKVKKPNLTGRRYWNFVQTKGCAISGNIPASSKAAIANIFDGGITFWHNGDQVGNYQQQTSQGTIDNPII